MTWEARIPHPERIIYPEAHIARSEVVSYYAEVAPYLLEQGRGRALTVKRWPHGIDGPMFYQKHPANGGPIVVTSTEALITWVGQGALEWHAPLGFADSPLVHDWAILDLDPNPPAGWAEVIEVGGVFKNLLELMDIPYLLKTSGQRGLHFYVGIRPLHHQRILAIMGQLADVVERTLPDLATTARLKRDRGARVYLDYLQNGYSRTTVMAYSLRATPSATVSAPITWDQRGLGTHYWTIDRVRAQLRSRGNLWMWQQPRVDLEVAVSRFGMRGGAGER